MDQIPTKFRTRSADRALAGMIGPVTCTIQMEMVFDYELDEKRLEKAVYLLTEKLPLLGCCFVERKIRPFFQRLDIKNFSIFHLTKDQDQFESYINERMDFFNGPQIGTCLYRSGSEDHLLVKVSHMVCDAAGVKEIVAQLSKIYNRLKTEPHFKPEPDLSDNRSFWRIVRQVPWLALPRIFFNYVCEIFGSKVPGKSHVVPMKKASSDKVRLCIEHVEEPLLSRINSCANKQQTTLNDILVTAIIRALSKTGELAPGEALRLGMAVDMRRYLPEEEMGTIANFSSLELFNYGSSVEKNFESTLVRVSQQINQRKASWLGLSAFVSTYPLLWMLPFFLLQLAGTKGWDKRSSDPNSFDWLTNMGVIRNEQVNFDGEPTSAWLLTPGCILPMLFFGCSSYNGTLTFSWSTDESKENQETAQAFFNLVFSELESIQG